MLKLTVISGPNRGTSYPIQEGETSIGRQAGNSVVLQSSKVSKRHCVLVVDNDEIIVKDAGSSNGTFVNGVLTKMRKVKVGDRISVGEYVFEVIEPQVRQTRPVPAAGLGNVLQFPTGPSRGMPGANPAMSGGYGAGASEVAPPPAAKDLKGRVIHFFESGIMPIFYNLNLKHEWKSICIGAFGVFLIGNLVVSVAPLLRASREVVIKETQKRALFMARLIAEKNAPILAARHETKTEVGSIETAEGVRLAVLVDLDNRILAPSTRFNQYLVSGSEASFAVSARDKFRSGRETGIVVEVDESTVVAIEPVKIMSPAAGKNIIVAMAVVSVDSSLATPGLGEMGSIYSETLIFTGILGGLMLLILYRLTLKPLQVLNEDMDKVLKGDMPQVTREFKFQELESLWDLINSALQRVPRAGLGVSSGLGGGFDDSASGSVEEFAGPMRMIGGIGKFGTVICDQHRKIIYLNSIFEDLSGIRSDSAIGQDVAAVARDQSLGPFVNDLFERAPVGGDGICEEYDFSGIGCKVYAGAFGTSGSAARCFVLAVVRND